MGFPLTAHCDEEAGSLVSSAGKVVSPVHTNGLAAAHRRSGISERLRARGRAVWPAPSALGENQHIDDLVCIGIDDADHILHHDVLVAPPFRNDHDDVLRYGDQVHMSRDHYANGHIDVDIGFRVRAMAREGFFAPACASRP
jgi:hypothetical protein